MSPRLLLQIYLVSEVVSSNSRNLGPTLVHVMASALILPLATCWATLEHINIRVLELNISVLELNCYSLDPRLEENH